MDEATDGDADLGRPSGQQAAALDRWMSERLRGRRLVVEAGLSESLLEDLQAGVRSLQLRNSTPDIARDYPALFLSYLTTHGVFRYEAGRFWRLEPLGLQHQKIVDDITAALRLLDLESFDRMVDVETSMGGVSRMLAHGGIPRYSLGDFFEVLVGDVGRVDGAAVDLMAFWQSRSSRFTNRDKPIKRFLDYGGAISLDFLDRCIDLVHLTVQSGEVPPADDVGLPEHVVTAFASFIKKQPLNLTQRPTTERLPRPIVRIDPWGGEGPELDLAPVPERYRTARWRVTGAASTACSTIEWQSLPLDRAQRWTVSITETSTVREWTIPGLEGAVPFLAFDAERMTAVNVDRGLASSEVILLVPTTATIEGRTVDGAAVTPEIVEQLPPTSGEWNSFAYRWISLVDVTELIVRYDGSIARVRVRNPASAVQLAGNAVSGTTSEGIAVYADPPALVVPTIAGLAGSAWSLKVTLDGEVQQLTIEDLPTAETGRSLASLLPQDRASRVDLIVRGPLGSDLRESFVVVPGLSVFRPERLILPTDRTTEVEVTAPNCTTTTGAPVEHLRLPVGEDESAVSLSLLDANERPFAIRVAVDKVLWALQPAGKASQRFTTLPVQLPFEDLIDGPPLTLKVRCGDSRPELRLELIDAGQALLQEMERAPSSEASGHWTFHLNAFTDTLRASTSSTHLLRLWVGVMPCTVARIVAPVTAHGLLVKSQVSSDATSVSVEFTDPRPGKDRAVRLWSLARLWTGPVTEPLDEGATSITISRPREELPAGPYLVEVTVDDGWTTPARPTSCASDAVVREDVGSQSDIAAHIDSLGVADPHELIERTLLTSVRDRRLTDTELLVVAPDVIETVTAGFELAANGVRVPQGYLPIQAILRAHPAATAHGFNEFATRYPDRRHLLLGLALSLLARMKPDFDELAPTGEMEGLWHTCPPLAARLDLLDEPSDERSDRLLRFLGWIPSHGRDSVTPDGALTPLELGMPPEVLKSVLAGSSLVPERLLDGGTAQEAQAEWLIANASKDIEVDAWGHPSTAARRWMQQYGQLLHGLGDVPEIGREHVKRRLVDKIGANDEFGWGSLPAVTLAAAFHVLTDDDDRPLAIRALTDAASFAPRLVERDLVLAQVLLPFPQRKPDDVLAAVEDEPTDGAPHFNVEAQPVLRDSIPQDIHDEHP